MNKNETFIVDGVQLLRIIANKDKDKQSAENALDLFIGHFYPLINANVEMVDAAKQLFDAVDSGSENKDEIKARLDQIEADFSDDPAYVAAVKLECKARQ